MVEAYERAVAEGRGAASLDGKMIDAANIRMARVILRNRRQITGAATGVSRSDKGAATKIS